MPSIDPTAKQEIIISLLQRAEINYDNLKNDIYPIEDHILTTELSLLNGISKSMLIGTLNDMILCGWLNRDEKYNCIIITSGGMEAKRRMQENVTAKKRTKELRKRK